MTTSKYYDMHWTLGQYFTIISSSCEKKRSWPSHNAPGMQKYDFPIARKYRCTGQSSGRRKGDELSDEETRKFMVKIRTLLVDGGFPVDYGWRMGLPESIHTIGDKGEENESSSEEVQGPANRNDVQFMRSHRRDRALPPPEIHVGATSTATIASERGMLEGVSRKTMQ